MAYTNNVPQGSQQIATTQPIIQANFGFLQSGIGIEHNFAPGGSGSDMYHLQASMPNRAGGDPIALPAGTNGMYYVRGGLPKFYNTIANFIQLTNTPYKILTGTVALTNNSQTVFLTVPQFSCGAYFLIPNNSKAATTVSAMGFFVSSNTVVQPGQVEDPGMSVGTLGGLDLVAQTDVGNQGNFTYFAMYFTP